jgi:hypothetical protein
LSFLTFTLPVAAGTTDELKKDSLVAHEVIKKHHGYHQNS